MVNLSTNEKQVLEKLFQMSEGHVLNFSHKTMGEFFSNDIRVDLYDEKYNYASGSKANRMRGFWIAADNPLVGESIVKLIEYIENQILLADLQKSNFPQELITKGKQIGNRLLGKPTESDDLTENEFLKQEFKKISIDSLGLSRPITNIIQQRLGEIQKCLHSKAPLATIFLCGSTLEGILLGIATKNPEKFNRAKTSPKAEGTVKQFQDWTLNDLINVSKETGFIKEDVKKFSHSLRDFRNYIHPYEQVAQGFSPNEHTAKICWQVLMAAISQISKR